MSKSPPVKLNWLERAIQVYNYHVASCKDDSSWTLVKTANSLQRSLGSVSQDIKIASWVRTHESRLKKFRSMRDALDWIKSKEKEMKLSEIDL